MGVASVALLYGAVRRWAGPVAGLLAGAALALTPAAVLMFRFDNPDALLTLLLVAGGYAVVRAVDAASVQASTWWLVGRGRRRRLRVPRRRWGRRCWSCPAFGLAYLVAGPTRLRTRLLQLLAALGAMIVSAGWYVALVELWPAADRARTSAAPRRTPCSSWRWATTASGRILGGSGNGGGGGAAARATPVRRRRRDHAAVHRRARAGGVVAAARGADLLVAGLVVVTCAAPRTDRLRAAALLWGGWTLVTGLVFSFMSGTMHPYYTVALAPGIAALVGVGAQALWTRRASLVARGTLALMVAATAGLELRAAGRLDGVVRVDPLGGRGPRRRGGRGAAARGGPAAPRRSGGRRRRAADRARRDQRVRGRDGVGGPHRQHPERRRDQQRDGRRSGRGCAVGRAAGRRRGHDRRGRHHGGRAAAGHPAAWASPRTAS